MLGKNLINFMGYKLLDAKGILKSIEVLVLRKIYDYICTHILIRRIIHNSTNLIENLQKL